MGINGKVTLPIIVVCVFIATQVNAEVFHVPSDDYPTISSALEDVFSGDHIIVAAGHYAENLVISVGGFELVGAGQDQTVIMGESDEPTIKVEVHSGPPRLRDFTVQGGQEGIQTTSGAVDLSGVVVRDTTGDGISILNGSTLKAIDCQIGPTGASGITINRSNAILESVTVLRTEQNGINLYAPTQATLTHVTLMEPRRSGIYASSAWPSTILDGVLVSGSYGNGLEMHQSAASIINTTVLDSKANGLYVVGYNTSTGTQLSLRSCIISRSYSDGVLIISDGRVNLGTSDSPGNNEIYRNRGFSVNNGTSPTIAAIGNWWGQNPPDSTLFSGDVDYKPWLTEPPISSLPQISQVEPNIGATSGGTLIRISGSNFAIGATVMIGDQPATGVSVESETQITAVTPAGSVGSVAVTITNPDGEDAFAPDAFTYATDDSVVDTLGRSSGTYQVELDLQVGVNILSLPLRTAEPLTASKLAQDVSSTVVIRASEGEFQAYVHEGSYGVDFPIGVGEGVIVNLLEARSYQVSGKPWGIEVATAPTLPASKPWAFVVSGRFLGATPPGASVQVTNRNTGHCLLRPISGDGTFLGAFVDMSQQAVVAPGDALTFEVADAHGKVVTQLPKQHLTAEDVAQAHMHATFQANPKRTQLLPNFPNPFNPETWIPYQLAEAGKVVLELHDLSGQIVRHMDLGYRDAGWYLSKSSTAYWDGRNDRGERVSSGIYVCCLRSKGITVSRKLILAK